MTAGLDFDRIRGLELLGRLVFLIAVTTAAAGAFQMVAPGVILAIIDGPDTTAAKLEFAMVGMFMFVIGGVVVHTLLAGPPHTPTILWAGIQKLGAVVMVTTGIALDVFSPLAFGVAAFDAASCIVTLAWWNKIR